MDPESRTVEDLSVDEFVDRIVDIVIESVTAGFILSGSKRISYIVPGWALYHWDFDFRFYVHRLIIDHPKKDLPPHKVLIPGIRLYRKPKKPK